MKVVLPCYYQTEESGAKIDAGIKIELSDLKVKRSIFYNITGLSSMDDESGIQTCEIWHGDTASRIPLAMKDVELLIDNAILTGFADGWKPYVEKMKANA